MMHGESDVSNYGSKTGARKHDVSIYGSKTGASNPEPKKPEAEHDAGQKIEDKYKPRKRNSLTATEAGKPEAEYHKLDKSKPLSLIGTARTNAAEKPEADARKPENKYKPGAEPNDRSKSFSLTVAASSATENEVDAEDKYKSAKSKTEGDDNSNTAATASNAADANEADAEDKSGSERDDNSNTATASNAAGAEKHEVRYDAQNPEDNDELLAGTASSAADADKKPKAEQKELNVDPDPDEDNAYNKNGQPMPPPDPDDDADSSQSAPKADEDDAHSKTSESYVDSEELVPAPDYEERASDYEELAPFEALAPDSPHLVPDDEELVHVDIENLGRDIEEVVLVPAARNRQSDEELAPEFQELAPDCEELVPLVLAPDYEVLVSDIENLVPDIEVLVPEIVLFPASWQRTRSLMRPSMRRTRALSCLRAEPRPTRLCIVHVLGGGNAMSFFSANGVPIQSCVNLPGAMFFMNSTVWPPAVPFRVLFEGVIFVKGNASLSTGLWLAWRGGGWYKFDGESAFALWSCRRSRDVATFLSQVFLG